jgi:hypothetical protein
VCRSLALQCVEMAAERARVAWVGFIECGKRPSWKDASTRRGGVRLLNRPRSYSLADDFFKARRWFAKYGAGDF